MQESSPENPPHPPPAFKRASKFPKSLYVWGFCSLQNKENAKKKRMLGGKLMGFKILYVAHDWLAQWHQTCYLCRVV